MTVFSNTYDKATPVGTDAPSTLDDQHRNTKAAIQERENVDHFWELTGTQVSDVDSGEHRKLTLHEPLGADPSNVANKGFIYTKDVSGVVELFWEDESGNVIQLTTLGVLNITSTDLLGKLANNTYFTAIDNAGTGTVNLIKAGTNDLATLPDSAEMATSAAPVEDEAIANKKYIDDQITAVTAALTAALSFGTLIDVDSEANALVVDHAYLAQQDGIVMAYVLGAGKTELNGYTHNTNDPAGAGLLMQVDESGNFGTRRGITFSVPSGRYFEVTNEGSQATKILWQPTQTSGSAPVDQD